MWLDLGRPSTRRPSLSGVDGAEIDAARDRARPLLDEPLAISLAATPETVTLDASAAGGGGNRRRTPSCSNDAGRGRGSASAITTRATPYARRSRASGPWEPSLETRPSIRMRSPASWRPRPDSTSRTTSSPGSATPRSTSRHQRGRFRARRSRETTDADRCRSRARRRRERVEQAAGCPADPPAVDGARRRASPQRPRRPGGRGRAARRVLVGAPSAGRTRRPSSLELARVAGRIRSFRRRPTPWAATTRRRAYVALQDFLIVAEKGDDDGAPDYDAIRPYTDALDYLIFGTAVEDDREQEPDRPRRLGDSGPCASAPRWAAPDRCQPSSSVAHGAHAGFLRPRWHRRTSPNRARTHRRPP